MYLLAIDQGTSSTRAMIYSLDWKVLHICQYPITQYYPHDGFVEHDPEEMWNKTLAAIHGVVGQVDATKIIACGLTNQRETTLLWDKQTGQCLAPAIVWQDRRTQDFCQQLAPHAEMIHVKTGLFPDAYFSASKLNWLLNNIPNARELAAKNRLAFGTVDSFLLWRLSGGKKHVTDVTNASRTLLFNIFSQTWDPELLELFDIPDNILPEVYASDAYFADIDASLLGVSIPITGVVGDQQAAMIGQGCFDAGMIKATYGTGGFLLLNTGTQPILSKHRLLTTIAYRVQGTTFYGLEGSIYDAGSTLKWLRDELHLLSNTSESEVLARSLASNEGVYLVPSFSGLGAPYWFTSSGAAVIGLSRHSQPAHFVRAALESVAYQTNDILNAMRKDSLLEFSVLRVDGGMAANAWLLQFMATLTGLSVQRPNNIETSTLGAARLAALGCGAIDSLTDSQHAWPLEKEFFPDKSCVQMMLDYQAWLEIIRRLTAPDHPA